MKVKFFQEKEKAKKIKKKLFNNFNSILNSGKYTNGEFVYKFEKKFSEFIGTKNCVAVNSGTSALHLSLIALGIKRNDEVILPAITFVASAAAITYVGAKPVFVDINESDWLMDVDQIEKAITKKTKAIMPVHLHGLMCDMKKIKNIANKYKLKVIEDASQAHGSEYYKFKPGHYSDVATFSFYPTKNLGAIGEGGAVITNNKKLFQRVNSLRAWSPSKKDFFEIGYNYRMPEIVGASLLQKIKYLKQDIKKRINISGIYKKYLIQKSYSKFNENSKRHAYHIFAIRVKRRDEFIKKLKKYKIDSSIHYSYLLPKINIFSKYGQKFQKFNNASKVCKELISLPLYPELQIKHQLYVIKIVNKLLN